MTAMSTPPARTLSDVLRDIMIEIALRQTDPAERDAMLEIMRKDGWIDEIPARPPCVSV